MTDFLVDHIQDNMLAIVKQNNPMLLVEYGIAVLNFLNEQSQIATDDSELSTRRAIRALIMTSLEDLPRETTCAIQQMAGVAQFVTVSIIFLWLNPIALRKAKIVYNFGLSECNRVKILHVCL